MEIREIFIEQIMDFFKENIKKNGDTVKAFCNALQKGEAEEAEQRFSDYLRKTISIRDTFVKNQRRKIFIMVSFWGSWAIRIHGSYLLMENPETDTVIFL